MKVIDNNIVNNPLVCDLCSLQANLYKLLYSPYLSMLTIAGYKFKVIQAISTYIATSELGVL